MTLPNDVEKTSTSAGHSIRISVMKTIYLLWMILAVSTTGCIVSPTKDDRSGVENMNGQNYESSNAVVVAPVVAVLDKKVPIQRKISGRAFCGEGLEQSPANHAKLTLKDGPTVLSTASTDSVGQYSFLASVGKSKSYNLIIEGKCGRSEKTVNWGEGSAIEGQDAYLK
jgi:hypothetical protein